MHQWVGMHREPLSQLADRLSMSFSAASLQENDPEPTQVRPVLYTSSIATAWRALLWRARGVAVKICSKGTCLGLEDVTSVLSDASSMDWDRDVPDVPPLLAVNDRGKTLPEFYLSDVCSAAAVVERVWEPAKVRSGAQLDTDGVEAKADTIRVETTVDACYVDLEFPAVPPLPSFVGRRVEARDVVSSMVGTPAAEGVAASMVDADLAPTNEAPVTGGGRPAATLPTCCQDGGTASDDLSPLARENAKVSEAGARVESHRAPACVLTDDTESDDQTDPTGAHTCADEVEKSIQADAAVPREAAAVRSPVSTVDGLGVTTSEVTESLGVGNSEISNVSLPLPSPHESAPAPVSAAVDPSPFTATSIRPEAGSIFPVVDGCSETGRGGIALEVGTVPLPSLPRIASAETRTATSFPGTSPTTPMGTAPGGGDQPFTSRTEGGGSADSAPDAGPAPTGESAKADTAGAGEATRAAPSLSNKDVRGFFGGLMVKVRRRHAQTKAAKAPARKEGNPAPTKRRSLFWSSAVSSVEAGTVSKDVVAQADTKADEAGQRADVDAASVNVPTYSSIGATSSEAIISEVPTLAAASGAASPPFAVPAQVMGVARDGSGSRAEALFASGGSGGTNTEAVAAGSAAAMVLTPPRTAVDGVGSLSTDYLASGVWTTSGGWAPAGMVPPNTPGEPPANVYAWSPAVMYAPRAPGGGDGGGGGGIPFVPPVQYAYMHGGGQKVPPHLAERFVALPMGPAAAAAAAAATKGRHESDIPGESTLAMCEEEPPEMPVSLYESHGPEDPAMVASVMPAVLQSPLPGNGFGMLPAESFSDEVDVDMLFHSPSGTKPADSTV